MRPFQVDPELYTPSPAANAPTLALVREVEQGYPFARLLALKERLGLDQAGVLGVLGMSESTFHRRRKEGRLTPEESGNVYALERVFERAAAVMGGEAEARRFLATPSPFLGGGRPLELLSTVPGRELLATYLGQVDEGVLV